MVVFILLILVISRYSLAFVLQVFGVAYIIAVLLQHYCIMSCTL